MGIIGTCEGYFSSPFYLFNNGSWNGLSSVGMSMIDNPNNRNSLSVSGTINLTTYHKLNHGCAARTNSTFDFTNYSYLKFVIAENNLLWSNYTHLGISNNNNTRSLTASVNPSSGTCTVNISSVSGWYYIYIVVGVSGSSSDISGNSSLKISQIYVSNS